MQPHQVTIDSHPKKPRCHPLTPIGFLARLVSRPHLIHRYLLGDPSEMGGRRVSALAAIADTFQCDVVNHTLFTHVTKFLEKREKQPNVRYERLISFKRNCVTIKK